ncbi:MAG: hypothetical protein ACYDBH_10995 [Acidobacteriaceae bacterium]
MDKKTVVNLRSRGRTDLDARARREQMQRNMVAALESAGTYFGSVGDGQDGALIAALAAGTWRPASPEQTARAQEILHRYAEHIVALFDVFRHADDAARECLQVERWKDPDE